MYSVLCYYVLEQRKKTNSIKAIIEPQHKQIVKNNKKTVSTDIHSESVRFKWLAQKRQHKVTSTEPGLLYLGFNALTIICVSSILNAL